MTTDTTPESFDAPFKAKPTAKPRGNLSKSVVQELVSSASPEQIEALFTGKDNKPCTLVSRARTVEVLGLTGAKKKAVEEYTYPKRKSRKASVKKGTVSKATITKEAYKDLSNDKLITSIKELSKQLQAMKDQLNDRLK